jgi:hypothetical protein
MNLRKAESPGLRSVAFAVASTKMQAATRFCIIVAPFGLDHAKPIDAPMVSFLLTSATTPNSVNDL